MEPQRWFSHLPGSGGFSRHNEDETDMRRQVLLLFLTAGFSSAQPAAPCCRVVVAVHESAGQPVASASVRIASGAMKYEQLTTDAGESRFELRTPGRYLVLASAPGYESQTRELEVARDANVRIELTLLRQDSITVESEVSPLDPAPAAAARDQIRSLPERVADLRNALPLIPGVVRTPEGRLQIGGNPEYRSTFLVNGIDVTDPATGAFGATVPIDVIETVKVYKSPFSAEYGRFSASVVAVETRRGGEKWHMEVNDPTPEFRIRSGRLRGVRGFTPRFAATGPLIRQKLYFAGAGSFELRKRPVYPLPFPFNEEKSQRVNAYAQFDVIPRPRHFLSISAHGVPQRVNFANLNFYTPQPAAPSSAVHEYRAAVSERMETREGILEAALAVSELRTRTGAQGEQPLTLSPITSSGNYFFNQDRRSQRGQFSGGFSLHPKSAFGRQHFKIGASLARSLMDGFAAARAVHIVSLDAAPLFELTYRNQNPYRLSNWDGGIFAQNGWEPVPLLRLDLGFRVDFDHLARATTVAPRLGLAWLLDESGRMLVRGGFGWFYDRVPLNVFAFAHYPERLGLPNLTAQSRGFTPGSRTVALAVDRKFGESFLLHAGLVRSVSSQLLFMRPELSYTVLDRSGASKTQELELSAKFSGRAERLWVLSYVHTRGRGNLNTSDKFLGDFPEPMLRQDVMAPLPGIVRNRLLSWALLPLRWGLRLSPLVEWRSGFPYAALDGRQQYAGVPYAQTLPAFFSLDASIAKDIPLRGHKARVSFSIFNLTDHGNYDAIRLNRADGQFGEVLGRRPRRFRLDFDWLF